MDFKITEEQDQLKNSIKEFGQKVLSPGADKRDADQQFASGLWKEAGKFGIQGLPVSEEYGGSGLDPLSTAIALEGLGYGNEDGGLSFAITAHLLACTIPVWKFGSQNQKEKFLPGLCNGDRIAVNGMTEAQSGSDVFEMSTRAEKSEGGYILNGIKTFASNAPVADTAIIYAKTGENAGFTGGITAFIVDTSSDGYSKGQHFEKMGLRTCPIGEIILENVFVPDGNRLGDEGSGGFIFNHSMEWERSLLIAVHVGTMERLVDISLKYANERQAGGSHIGRFQGISHKLSEMKVMLESARLLTYKAAWSLGRSKSNGLDASIAKYYTSKTFKSLTGMALEIFGGYGYMREYNIERVLRDAVAGTIYSGTSNIQKNIIARWMGVK